MINRIVLFVSLLVSVPLGLSAQQLTLAECVDRALTNNQNVKNAALAVTSTEYEIRETKSALLPTIDLNGQYQYYFEVPGQVVPANAFGGPEGAFQTVELGVPQSVSANVQLSQTLYNQQVLLGLKAAKVARQASTLELALTQEELIYNVSATYYNVQVLQESLQSLEKNIENLEKSVKVNETLKDNDLIPTSRYKRLLINLENLKNQRENQQLQVVQNLNMLKYLMSMPITTPLSVVPFESNSIEGNLQAGSISNRKDIQLQQESIRLAELDKKSTKAGYYPSLQADLFYGYTGYNDEFNPTENINNQWISSSYFSLSLRVPIFDGFNRKYQLKQKEVALQQSNNTLQMMRINAEQEIQDAYNNYLSYQNLLDNNQRSLTLAEDLFKNANVEYQNGLINITDYLAAQDDLTDARNNYTTALINLQLAALQLKKANGELKP
ncbi:MAG: TolC family protein [Thermonemataceae bacterium]